MKRIPLTVALKVALGVTSAAIYPLAAHASNELDDIAQACGAGLAAGIGSESRTETIKIPMTREFNIGATTPEVTLGPDVAKAKVPSFELFRHQRFDVYSGGIYQPQFSETRLFNGTLKYTDAYVPVQGVCFGISDQVIKGVADTVNGGSNDGD